MRVSEIWDPHDPWGKIDMNCLKVLIRMIDGTSEKVAMIVSILMPAMAAVIFYEVIARYVFNSPTIWGQDLAVFMFGYLGMLSGAYVLKQNAHINVDIVYTRFSNRGQAVLNSVSYPLVLFFVLLVLWKGWESARLSYELKETTRGLWTVPVWHFKLMLALGGFLLVLQGLVNWVKNLYLAITGKELKS